MKVFFTRKKPCEEDSWKSICDVSCDSLVIEGSKLWERKDCDDYEIERVFVRYGAHRRRPDISRLDIHRGNKNWQTVSRIERNVLRVTFRFDPPCASFSFVKKV